MTFMTSWHHDLMTTWPLDKTGGLQLRGTCNCSFSVLTNQGVDRQEPCLNFRVQFRLPFPHKTEQYVFQKSAKIKKNFPFSLIFKQRMSGFKVKFVFLLFYILNVCYSNEIWYNSLKTSLKHTFLTQKFANSDILSYLCTTRFRHASRWSAHQGGPFLFWGYEYNT